MELSKVPEPFRSRLEHNEFVSEEVRGIIYDALDEEATWEEVENRIFNGLDYIINEARKAQSHFHKE